MGGIDNVKEPRRFGIRFRGRCRGQVFGRYGGRLLTLTLLEGVRLWMLGVLFLRF